MKRYLDLLRDIRENGKFKHPSREGSGETKNPTVGLPNLHFSHDLREGFPLLTTRGINWGSLVGELRSFLLGNDNEKQFAANGCRFWKPWAKPDGDLGPIYGVQWNKHGQLAHVLDCLRNRPTDRRLVVSAWRPDEHDQMVLPPCHVLWVATPYHNLLSLAWIQRSCDFPIGVPYNIASYALLTHLLAEWAGMGVWDLSCIFCDAHIYENQFDGVYKQLNRNPLELPEVRVWFEDPNDFNSWQVELMHWEHLDNIDFGEVEV